MSEELNLYREVYGQNTYTRVVDTEFKQLIDPVETDVLQDITVDEFFNLYESLFFEIPINGNLNTHEYLVRRSTEYLGGSVISDNEKALLEEINSLRQQLLDTNSSLIDISKLT
jgi:hypothetical protein